MPGFNPVGAGRDIFDKKFAVAIDNSVIGVAGDENKAAHKVMGIAHDSQTDGPFQFNFFCNDVASLRL